MDGWSPTECAALHRAQVDWGVLLAGRGLVALQVEGLGLAAARRIREHVLPHLPHCRWACDSPCHVHYHELSYMPRCVSAM